MISILKPIVITVAAATLSLGTIFEKDGVVSRDFMLHNEGEEAVALVQTFPSCGCTTIDAEQKGDSIMPGDSILVKVSFNPKNKGGEFYETATLVFANSTEKASTVLALEGTCITSEETLMKQYPVKKDFVRLTRDHADLGELRRGDSKTTYIGVLHRGDSIWKESVPMTITVDNKMGWGEQHVSNVFTTVGDDGEQHDVAIDFTVVVLPAQNDMKGGQSIVAPRTIDTSENIISITNGGDDTLCIYRAYAADGTDLIKRPLSIKKGKEANIKIPSEWLSADDDKAHNRITLITNDQRHPRYIIRRKR